MGDVVKLFEGPVAHLYKRSLVLRALDRVLVLSLLLFGLSCVAGRALQHALYISSIALAVISLSGRFWEQRDALRRWPSKP